MTPSPISPTPVAPLTAVSGGAGNTTVSGLSPVSGYLGPSGTFNGPHFIEEQWMTVDYFRVPQYYFNNVQTYDFSLSAGAPMTTVVSGNVAGTRVWAKVTASVRIVKNYDRFGTSSYQQPQKFQILATSADANANTYGAVPAGALGPAGTILTSQKFYNRRPWETTDTEVDYTTHGFTYQFNPSSTGTYPNTVTYYPAYGYTRDVQEQLFGQFWAEAGKDFPELLPGEARGSHFSNRMYQGILNGPYLGANDQTVFAEQILDHLGDSISNGYSLYYGPLATTSTDYWTALGQLSAFDTSSGGAMPDYDTSRHDYS